MFKEKIKKGVFFVPTMLTMGNILCGFFAIIASFNEDWLPAAIAIGIAFFLDGLDGRIARLTDTETDFGLELDSLADLVTFGVSPAILAYTRWLAAYERLGILLAFVFVCGAAMRLARFNAHDVKEKSMDYFNGFPTPAAAGVVVSLYFIEYRLLTESELLPPAVHQIFIMAVPVVLLVLSYIMLSNLRYPTFKNITFHEEHPFGILFIMLCFVFIAALFPFYVFSGFFFVYLFAGVLNVAHLVDWLLEKDGETEHNKGELPG